MGDQAVLPPLVEPTLSAGDVLLRPWTERDVDVVLAAGRDELVTRYRYSLPRTTTAASTWLEATRTERLAGTRLELALTECGKPLGSVSIAEIAHGNAEIRYWLLHQGQGRGLATTAVRLLTTYAFHTLGLAHLTALIEPENEASAVLLQRCGFLEEGRLRRHFTNHDGDRVDGLIFGLLPEDLPK